MLLFHFNERTQRHRVELNLHHVTQVLNSYVSPNFSQSVKSFVLNETKSRPLLWRVSLPLFWIHMRSAPPAGEGCGTGQVPTLPHIFFHFGRPVIPLIPSLAICGGIIFELLTVILVLRPGLCVPLSWKHVWYRQESESYEARRQFSFLDA